MRFYQIKKNGVKSYFIIVFELSDLWGTYEFLTVFNYQIFSDLLFFTRFFRGSMSFHQIFGEFDEFVPNFSKFLIMLIFLPIKRNSQ